TVCKGAAGERPLTGLLPPSGCSTEEADRDRVDTDIGLVDRVRHCTLVAGRSVEQRQYRRSDSRLTTAARGGQGHSKRHDSHQEPLVHCCSPLEEYHCRGCSAAEYLCTACSQARNVNSRHSKKQ